MTALNDGNPVCALGLNAIEVGKKFEKIEEISNRMDNWENEGGILYKMEKGIERQNGRVRTLERIIIAISAFLAGLGVLQVWEWVKIIK